jgi:AcrR family transcriptional regulator
MQHITENGLRYSRTIYNVTSPRRPGRSERSDSVRNREKLLASARALLAAEGLNAPMDKIATAAGVGAGTLYRHFPTRVQLWEAVLEEPLREQLAVVQRAVANPDRWAGVADFIVSACALEAESEGYLDLMTTRYDDAPKLFALRTKIQREITRLFARARKEGAIRPDFATEDLIFIMLSNSRVAQVTRSIAPDAWRRNVDFLLDAMRPERAHPLSRPPMTPAQIFQTMKAPATGKG